MSKNESINTNLEVPSNEDEVPLLDLNAMLDPELETSTKARGSKIKWHKSVLADEIAEANTILDPKDARGTSGSRDWIRNLKAATTPLDPKMGVPSHFVSSRNGKTESRKSTKFKYIQEVFVQNLRNNEVRKASFGLYQILWQADSMFLIEVTIFWKFER